MNPVSGTNLRDLKSNCSSRIISWSRNQGWSWATMKLYICDWVYFNTQEPKISAIMLTNAESEVQERIGCQKMILLTMSYWPSYHMIQSWPSVFFGHFSSHNDLPWNIRKFIHNKIHTVNFTYDLRNISPWSRSAWSHTDLNRLKQGRVGAQVSLWVFWLSEISWPYNLWLGKDLGGWQQDEGRPNQVLS